MSMDYTKQKCLVCGDKASGLHYTVISCESCKSFFGRKIKSKAKFTCEANGNCVMDLYTRRHCPACRLKKCLDVGMKPESEYFFSSSFLGQIVAILKEKIRIFWREKQRFYSFLGLSLHFEIYFNMHFLFFDIFS